MLVKGHAREKKKQLFSGKHICKFGCRRFDKEEEEEEPAEKEDEIISGLALYSSILSTLRDLSQAMLCV